MCYYFDDKINGSKINFSNISLDKKLYENIPVHKVSHKIPTCPNPLRIRFDKINRFIVSLDIKTKDLV